MLKSIMGRVVDTKYDPHARFARVLPPSGFRSTKAAPRFTGVHKQLGRAEMVALTVKLQRQASR